MDDGRDLLPPLTCVREVLETYRIYGILLPRWSTMLEASADDLEQYSIAGRPDQSLIDAVRTLSASDLSRRATLVGDVADETARTLRGIRVAGLPSPEDEDWAFG